jgi:hypothetical protein
LSGSDSNMFSKVKQMIKTIREIACYSCFKKTTTFAHILEEINKKLFNKKT